MPTEPAADSMPTSRESHRRVWDLLCWVAAGTATDAERRLVETHLADCPDCREELAFQRQIRDGLLQGEAEVRDAGPPFQRLMARIDAGDLHPEMPQPTFAPATAALSWTRWLAAAVVVQAVALAASGVALWERSDGSPGAEYQTLTSNSPATQRASVRLAPAASMDFAALQALLARHSLIIVEASADGSSFGLAVAGGAVQDAGVLLQRLRIEPGVLMAEPIAR